jgi:hypothetical protein
MASLIIIDTNLLQRIVRSSQPIADALKRYLKAGAQVYISRPAYKTLVDGAPTPQMGRSYRQMLADLRIQITASNAMSDRVNFFAGNM